MFAVENNAIGKITRVLWYRYIHSLCAEFPCFDSYEASLHRRQCSAEQAQKEGSSMSLFHSLRRASTASR
jgi:hypothetical protein